MPFFQYEAIDETGKTVKGTLEAESLQAANNVMSSRGLIPLKFEEEKEDQAGALLKKINAMFEQVNPKELILFTKQLRAMLNAGVPIVKAMQILESQSESKTLQKAAKSIYGDIQHGVSLSEAFEKHPNVFSRLYCNMLLAGEMSDNLNSVLERLIYIIEHEAKIRADIKSALQYPKMVLIALGIAFFVLLTFVIPQFVGIFSKTGLELPWPTKVALTMNVALKNYWYIMLTATIGVVVGLRQYFKTENGRFVRDSLLLSLPILGPLFQKAAMSRFSSIFAILQSSGVPVLQSLTILSETIDNAAIARSFDHVREKIEEGSGLSAPLKTAPYFPPMVVDMIAIGEESGSIEEMLTEISKHYDDEVEYAVKALSDAIGPILIVGLAAVVGFFALAIYMPMWDMTKMVKK